MADVTKPKAGSAGKGGKEDIEKESKELGTMCTVLCYRSHIVERDPDKKRKGNQD